MMDLLAWEYLPDHWLDLRSVTALLHSDRTRIVVNVRYLLMTATQEFGPIR